MMSNSVDTPEVFRVNIEVGDLERAFVFYNRLLAMEGRRPDDSRVSYDCGAVVVRIVKAPRSDGPHPLSEALYFLVNDLEAAFERAADLDCISEDDVHGISGGSIVVRENGERSFYAYDPWGNPLCFVDRATVLRD